MKLVHKDKGESVNDKLVEKVNDLTTDLFEGDKRIIQQGALLRNCLRKSTDTTSSIPDKIGKEVEDNERN